MKQDWQDTLEI